MRKKQIVPSAAWSYVLLASVIFTAFFVTLFPHVWHSIFYKGLFTVMYFSAVLNMEKHKKQVLLFSLLAFFSNWASGIFDLPVVGFVSKMLNILFFLYVVGALIHQVARAKTVTAKVILESINGYLLIGIVFAIVVAIVGEVDPNGFSFHNGTSDNMLVSGKFSDDLYYAFITMATVGYGDLLPVKPFAKSLATLIGVSGQLYIAIIIAMLVGKFASQRND